MPPPLPLEDDKPLGQGDELLEEDVELVNQETVTTAASRTVIQTADKAEDDDDDDQDIVNGTAEDAEATNPVLTPGPVAPVADMGIEAEPSTSGKKRGRPPASTSRSGSRTPAKTPAKTPSKKGPIRTPRTAAKGISKPVAELASAKSTTPTKRKADDGGALNGAPPAKKRGRPAKKDRPVHEPTRVLSARQAAIAAKQNFVPPKGVPAAKPAAAKGAKRGRPKQKETKEATGNAWEVEDILDSGIDSKTKVHMYLIKWKGFSDDANSWEPRKNLAGCAEILKAYEKKNKAKAATAVAAADSDAAGAAKTSKKRGRKPKRKQA